MLFKIVFDCGCFALMDRSREQFINEKFNCPKFEHLKDERHKSCKEVERFEVD